MVGIPLSGGAGELHCLGSSPLWAGRCKCYLGDLAYLLDHHSHKFTATLPGGFHLGTNGVSGNNVVSPGLTEMLLVAGLKHLLSSKPLPQTSQHRTRPRGLCYTRPLSVQQTRLQREDWRALWALRECSEGGEDSELH